MWVTGINHHLNMQGLIIHTYISLPYSNAMNLRSFKPKISDSPIDQWRWRIPFDRSASVHVNLRRKTTNGQRACSGIAQLPQRGNSARAGMQKSMERGEFTFVNWCKKGKARSRRQPPWTCVVVLLVWAAVAASYTAKLRCTHRVLVLLRST